MEAAVAQVVAGIGEMGGVANLGEGFGRLVVAPGPVPGDTLAEGIGELAGGFLVSALLVELLGFLGAIEEEIGSRRQGKGHQHQEQNPGHHSAPLA